MTLWIVIVVLLSISHLIFLQDVSLVVCVFSFFFLLTTKVHNVLCLFVICLGQAMIVIIKVKWCGEIIIDQEIFYCGL